MAKSIQVSIVVIACLIGATVGALSLPVGDAAAADPPCPGSWPGQGYEGPLADADRGRVAYQDYFTDSDGARWFVIRSSDSNGYTTVRAYPAGDDGYVTDAPDEVCYLIVRRPGDAEDAGEPTQVVFPREQEEPVLPQCPVAPGPGNNAGASGADASAEDEADRVLAELQRNAEEFEYRVGTRGGTYTVATLSEPLTFNLALADDTGSTAVLGYLFEGLTEISWLTDRPEPLLAERWDTSEDGLTWTFHLRQGVQWHDGQPFTAHDVEFTFNRIIYNAELEVDSVWDAVDMTVTVIDDHTIRFITAAPVATFLRSMATAIYPKHILEEHVDGGTFEDVWDKDTDPTEVVGTGSFMISSYEPGVRLVLSRNPNYWLRDAQGNRLPYLDEIVRITVADVDEARAKFREGSIDIYGVPGREVAMLEQFQATENFTIHQRGPGFGEEFVAFNMNPGTGSESGERYVSPEKLAWFRTREFRQAVAHVIDKNRIVDEVQHGHGFPQWSHISPASGDFYNPDVRRYLYDTGRANAFLDCKGWVDTDGDGIREDRAGNPIGFTMVTNVETPVRVAIGQLVTREMRRIGIDVYFQPIPFSELVPRLTQSYDWEAVLIGLTGGSDPGGGFNVWHSSGDLHLWHPNQSQPATPWEARIDELYVLASAEVDHERRVAYYHEAQAIAAENVPLIYTTLDERIVAVRNVFDNTTPTFFGIWDIRYLYRTDR